MVWCFQRRAADGYDEDPTAWPNRPQIPSRRRATRSTSWRRPLTSRAERSGSTRSKGVLPLPREARARGLLRRRAPRAAAAHRQASGSRGCGSARFKNAARRGSTSGELDLAEWLGLEEPSSPLRGPTTKPVALTQAGSSTSSRAASARGSSPISLRLEAPSPAPAATPTWSAAPPCSRRRDGA